MNLLRTILILIFLCLTTGCAAVPFSIGLIPGAPAYFTSVLDGGQTMYVSAVDERTTQQQMMDAIIAGHAQAELYKHKDIRPRQVITHCYFGKLYLVGEYDSQEQLRTIYECVEKVTDKRAVISRLYHKEELQESDFIAEQATYAEVEAQLLADYKVTSSPIEVSVVQGDIILLGVISDPEERSRIKTHALTAAGEGRVISYLYHPEISGPQPREMTVEAIPYPMVSANSKPSPTPTPTPRKQPVKKKPKKKIVPKEVKKPAKEQSVADNSPLPPSMVNGRVLGL